MTDVKHIFASRTVWANIVGLLALAASFFGFEVDSGTADQLIDAGLQLAAAASFIASTVFRITATRRLGG